MEYPRVVPSVFLVFDDLALVAERLSVVDVKERSARADGDDVVDVGSFSVASSAVGFECESSRSNVIPFGVVLS